MPVLGYLDDLILLPAMIWLALRLIPDDVVAELRAEATRRLAEGSAEESRRRGGDRRAVGRRGRVGRVGVRLGRQRRRRARGITPRDPGRLDQGPAAQMALAQRVLGGTGGLAWRRRNARTPLPGRYRGGR